MPPACGIIYFRFWAATSLGRVCTGPGFQSDGAQQSCPQGPHGSDAPLGMINEPTDSRNAAQLLWGAGMHWGGEGGVVTNPRILLPRSSPSPSARQ